MNTKKITKYSMLIAFIIVVIYDIVMAANGIKGDTISEITKNAFKYTGGVFFGLGYLIAHLGWYSDKRKPILLSMLVLIVGGIICGFIQSKLLIMPILYIIPGIPLGHIFWCQTTPPGMRGKNG